MEMMQISSLVERLTDDQLVQELQRPSGMAPLQVVMNELQRRAALRGGKPRGFADGGPVRGESERSRQLRETLGGIFPQARFTSGYRTPERNAQVGGVPNSWHTRNGGDAWDFVDPGLTLASAAASIARAGLPAGELLRHNVGSGMHFHYSPEGASIDGVAPPETPAPPPAPDLPNGFSNPENIANDAMGLGDRIIGALGLPAEAGNIQDHYANIANMMPDATEPYAKILSRLQVEEDRERGSNRGRALMDAGLAMMSARTPNFMSALAAGGAAGLSSRDRIQEEERGLMQSVIQAQLARSQAEQQQARASLEAASGIYRGDLAARAGAFSNASELTLGGARSRDAAAAANVNIEQNRLNREHTSSEAALARAAAAALRDKEIAAGRWESKSEEERYATLYQGAYAAASRAGQERAQRPKLDGSPGTEYRPATEEEIIAQAQRAATAGLAGPVRPTTTSGQAPARVGSTENRPPLSSILGD